MASRMNYKLTENTKDKNIYDVFEASTEQVIASFSEHNEARKLMRFLNLGGSFDGWTPSFFLKTFSVKK
ncbi:hypothetical protein UFOVP787_34 [uncultured Caudovirales phage]|uniref:Uncharacterized protein n=1 Tax=uncultured Caudovirales phage TaxID=2100421 RepID=A0A6J5NTP6_9CAUD|nr:hypothetical protein UFOVP787_34 [uncultured Caudovirales phage]